MDYRDWGRGEISPRERQPIAPWGDHGEPLPDEPSSLAGGSYRTPSRRRAIERGQQEPADTYVPRWALESGVEPTSGGGRHRHEADEDPPFSGSGWRSTETTSTWRRVTETTSWRELPAIAATPASDHTSEWTLGTPSDEQGYVGSRRADGGRPRRVPSSRQPVVWSAGPGSAAAPEPAEEREEPRPTRRRRRALEESWTRPVDSESDRWDRRAGSDLPAEPPVVDPWDASGLHAWERTTPSSRWDTPDGTGQWDRFTDTGQWDGTELRQGREPESDGWAWSARPEGFWSGTRLAGDDPRWMDTPASAPRSPAVAYTAPRPQPVAGRRRPEPVTGYRPAAAPRRRPELLSAGRWTRRIEDDLLDPDLGGPVRSLLYTAACYLVPGVLLFLWLLTLSGDAPPGCVTDITGGGCDSPRSHAFGSVVNGAPRFGLALATSLVMAVVLRRLGTTWRAATVALAAAVVGGGLSTVLISAVTGEPIG